MKNKIELPEEIKSELEYQKLSIYKSRLSLLKCEFPVLQKEYNKVSKLVYSYLQEHWNKSNAKINKELFKENKKDQELLNKWEKDLEHFFVTRWN